MQRELAGNDLLEPTSLMGGGCNWMLRVPPSVASAQLRIQTVSWSAQAESARQPAVVAAADLGDHPRSGRIAEVHDSVRGFVGEVDVVGAHERGAWPPAPWHEPQRLLACRLSQTLSLKDCTSWLAGGGPV